MINQDEVLYLPNYKILSFDMHLFEFNNYAYREEVPRIIRIMITDKLIFEYEIIASGMDEKLYQEQKEQNGYCFPKDQYKYGRYELKNIVHIDSTKIELTEYFKEQL